MKLKKFDTKVQHLKYKVLREVAREAWADHLLEGIYDIPKRIVPNKEATMRCCVYKERAILQERIRLAMGQGGEENVIQVVDIACDECPVSGYDVTEVCRGCLAHHCEDACKFNAISYDKNLKAHIDKTKCVNCGACAKVCPYTAIVNRKRPCENACKVKAIQMGENKAAQIDDSKCIACGACVYQCPFGAIVDKSYILQVIDLIKKSENNSKYKVYAVVAPSIAGQFTYAKLGQVITAMEALGFYHVVEAALGADLVAYHEAKELTEQENSFMTSSCCPAFVNYVEKFFPDLLPYVSSQLSPMAAIARYMKAKEPDCKIVFVGPCTAKKMEYKKETVSPYIDSVITFEELQALFDSKDIDLTELEEGVLDNASYFGRIFARSGGLADAVRQALKEQGLEDFPYNPVSCDGIEACRVALLKAKKGVLPNNFIEGMACIGGCIGGAGCLTHEEKNKKDVDQYGREAMEKTVTDALSVLK